MSEQAKVVFLGSDAICLPLLDYLLELDGGPLRLCAVVSQPDRPSGRGRKLRPNPVSAWALQKGVELLRPEKPDRELAERLAGMGLRLGLVMAYGHFIPRRVREAPLRGMVNFHASLLPAYRGASPVETAIAEGDAQTGVSLMEVVREMDAGGVADVEPVGIDPADTGPELRVKVAAACVPLLGRNLKALLAGEAGFEPQDASRASFCRKIRKEDGWLDFQRPAGELADRIRAFTPWPGAFFEHDGQRIKVGAASEEKSVTDEAPGAVLATEPHVDVACGGGVLRLAALQRPGGKMLPADEFLRGYAIQPGDRLEGRASEPLVRQSI